ncbi:MAG: hypothetical protein ABGZ17_12255, partial [Planctomycetaceae bacterium]
MHPLMNPAAADTVEFRSGTHENSRRLLTLIPTGDTGMPPHVLTNRACATLLLLCPALISVAADPPPKAMALGNRRELMLDNYLWERITGLRFRQHQP